MTEEAVQPSMQDIVKRKLSDDLEELGKVTLAGRQHSTQYEKALTKVRKRFGKRADKLTRRRDKLVARIVKRFKKHRDLLITDDNKTVTFRNGKLSARFNPEKFIVVDPDALELWLRSKGKWRENSKPQKRKLDLGSLKKNRGLTDQIPPEIAYFARDEMLHISMPEAKLEETEELQPLVKSVKEEETPVS